ncbi:hypothetical protein CSB37_03720 [bacterium DOLZORAL124_38_8]|nr:MAG: hypothetical protein CSB37_03720 [bacterium DOLZORAL124_38_8]
MKIALEKIQIVGLHQHAKVLLKELQKKGLVHISENKAFEEMSIKTHHDLFDKFDLNRIEFALKFLEKQAPKKPVLQSILTGGLIFMKEKEAEKRMNEFSENFEAFVTECEKLEVMFAENKNAIKALKEKIQALEPFKNFQFAIGDKVDTQLTKTVFGIVGLAQQEAFLAAMSEKSNLVDIEIIDEVNGKILARLTYPKTLQTEVTSVCSQNKFEIVNLENLFAEFEGKTPAEAIQELEANILALNEEIQNGKVRRVELAQKSDDLRIMYDYYSWKKDKNDTQRKSLQTKNLFVYEGWIPAAQLKEFQTWLKQVFVGEVVAEKVQPAEDEKIPALLKNNKGFAPFQVLTEMFGAPTKTEIDPTAGLSPFFVIAFGICLSDVGYGTLMLLPALFLLIFGKHEESSKVSFRMLAICGAAAIIGGVLLGGWLGLTPDQLPFLKNPANGLFYGQLMDPLKGSGSIMFLAGVFAIGFIQLVFGHLMDAAQRFATKDTLGGWLDGIGWFVFMVLLALWVAAKALPEIIPASIVTPIFFVYTALFVLAQGRSEFKIEKGTNPVIIGLKGIAWVLKAALMGTLGIFNGLIGYLSGVLSYSRLMALGLATGIIGASMNQTAVVLGDIVGGISPYLVPVVVIAFAIFGHSLNFALSALGAFIHSMRLQFIEFFNQFYKGGAPIFDAFSRKRKYVSFR